MSAKLNTALAFWAVFCTILLTHVTGTILLPCPGSGAGKNCHLRAHLYCLLHVWTTLLDSGTGGSSTSRVRFFVGTILLHFFFLLMNLQSVSLEQQMLMRKEPPICWKVWVCPLASWMSTHVDTSGQGSQHVTHGKASTSHLTFARSREALCFPLGSTPYTLQPASHVHFDFCPVTQPLSCQKDNIQIPLSQKHWFQEMWVISNLQLRASCTCCDGFLTDIKFSRTFSPLVMA